MEFSVEDYLVKCPFCGSKHVEFKVIDLKKRDLISIECSDCPAKMQGHIKHAEQDGELEVAALINFWNQRKPNRKVKK